MLNKIFEVFTKEYKADTNYQEFMEKMLPNFKLNNKNESVETIVGRLTDHSYVSNFEIKRYNT